MAHADYGAAGLTAARSDVDSLARPAKGSPWKVLSQETVYDGRPFVTLFRQCVRVADGREIDDFHLVALPDFAVAVPILRDGRILTQWQYKHGAGSYSLTFPAGHIEKGESPETAMRRELSEEVGHAAETIVSFGSYQVSGNQGCGRAHLFAMTGCHHVGAPHHDDLEAWDVRIMSVEEVDKALRGNNLDILPHLAVWLACRAHFGF